MNGILQKIQVDIFGESHALEVGCRIAGLPAGGEVDEETIRFHLRRRAPGQALTTPRQETDAFHFIAGVKNGLFTGGEVTAVIPNTNARPGAYNALAGIPRPGHADLAAMKKYGEKASLSGGGRFSGRLTAPLVLAASLVRKLLEQQGCFVAGKIIRVGQAFAEDFSADVTPSQLREAWSEPLPVQMQNEIQAAKVAGDSVGAVVSLVATPLAGWGEGFFNGTESVLSALLFSVPGVKGVGFGSFQQAATSLGSQYNDPIYFDAAAKQIRTATNHAGGINGGITNGMPLRITVFMRPTPSIFKPQQTVRFATGEQVEIKIEGRHDPCIALRAVPALESAVVLGLYDLFLQEKERKAALENG